MKFVIFVAWTKLSSYDLCQVTGNLQSRSCLASVGIFVSASHPIQIATLVDLRVIGCLEQLLFSVYS